MKLLKPKHHKVNPKSLKNLAPAWKPGQSGNPEGRKPRPFTDRILALSEELLSASEDGELIRRSLKLPETAKWADATVRKLIHEALKGNVAAFGQLADRAEGKPRETVDVDVSGLEGLAERLNKARKAAKVSDD